MLANHGSDHGLVNHSVEFVSEKRNHTENIENFWGVLKKWMRENKYIHSSKRSFYEFLGELLFNRKKKDISLKEWFEIVGNT